MLNSTHQFVLLLLRQTDFSANKNQVIASALEPFV